MCEAKLISKADFPIMIKYNGKDKIVSPREQFDVEKLEYIEEGKLPSELKIVKY